MRIGVIRVVVDNAVFSNGNRCAGSEAIPVILHEIPGRVDHPGR